MKRPHYKTVEAAIRRTMRSFDSEEVMEAVGRSNLGSMNAACLDETYLGVSIDAWEKILAFNGVDSKLYRSERYDCDNFAISLAGTIPMRWDINGCGIVLDWSGGHAYSALIVAGSEGCEIAVVEPQTDRFVLWPGGMYAAEDGLIMFA